MIKLIDARWFQIFLCLCWNKMIFLKFCTRSKKQSENWTATGHSGGANITAVVPCTYVMHLRDIKRTSGVPCLWTSVERLLHLRIWHSGSSVNFRSWIPRSLFSGWSIFKPAVFIGSIFPVLQIFLHLRYAPLQFNFLSDLTCELILKINIVPTEAQKNLKPIAVF